MSAEVVQLGVPTLVLHARQDSVVPFEERRRLAALIPGARFVSLESANHVLLRDEAAWSQFVGELNAFLEPATLSAGHDTQPARLAGLTRRELEVLDLIARGLDNQRIAERLVLSPKTVSNHITTIFDKLQVSNRAEAIITARDAGLGRERDSSR